jgi:hypothetical protein
LELLTHSTIYCSNSKRTSENQFLKRKKRKNDIKELISVIWKQNTYEQSSLINLELEVCTATGLQGKLRITEINTITGLQFSELHCLV